MNSNQTKVSLVRGDELSFTREARSIQDQAWRHQACVVRLGALVFFSTAEGEAWMLDPQDGQAACLAREGTMLPIPITENAIQFAVEWNADYTFDGEALRVVERSGGAQTVIGVPTAEIQRLIGEFPAKPLAGCNTRSARERLAAAGRNDLCPCGSGVKYKKCCRPKDEAVIRQTAEARRNDTVSRAEWVFPAPHPDFEGEIPDTESTFAAVEPDEPELPPEVEAEFERVWDEFEALPSPSTDQMDAFLQALLRLPPEATQWSDVFHRIARNHHADLPGAFRRVASSVPHTKPTGLSYFYWAAAEEFDRHGLRELLPEVVAGLRRFDLESYDPDGLAHIEYYLLANGFDVEILKLSEHFLPIMRQDEGLMPYAVPMHCHRVFEIRVGRCLLGDVRPKASVETLAGQLREGIEEEIDPDAARFYAGVIAGPPPSALWTREDFDLTSSDISEDDGAWQASLRLGGALLRVAGEAYRIEGFPPGCAFPALVMLLNSVYDSIERRKTKKAGGNLLDYLRPAGMEERIARSCRDIIGVNVPQARLLLQAHELLLHSALRNQLIGPAEAAQSEKCLARLRSKLKE